MKKLLSILAIAGFMAACNDSSAPKDANTADTSSTQSTTPPAVDTSTPASADATMKEGLMTLKDGKMMIVKGGAWAAMDEAVTCTNGRKVSTTGEVSKGDKKKMLTEGMMIDKDGQMMDKDGKMMDNTGWE